MTEGEKLTAYITELVLKEVRGFQTGEYWIPVGVSARHVHLTKEAVETLFGSGHKLTPQKALSQPGQFACEEQVDLIGPGGSMIERVRVLGPERSACQVEVSRTDLRRLHMEAPVRTSGDLEGTPGIRLKGPNGSLLLSFGVIIADRHIHMTPKDAAWFGVHDRERVRVRVQGAKGGELGQVVIRVSEKSRLDFHIDTDDANAFDLRQGQTVTVQKEGQG